MKRLLSVSLILALAIVGNVLFVPVGHAETFISVSLAKRVSCPGSTSGKATLCFDGTDVKVSKNGGAFVNFLDQTASDSRYVNESGADQTALTARFIDESGDTAEDLILRDVDSPAAENNVVFTIANVSGTPVITGAEDGAWTAKTIDGLTGDVEWSDGSMVDFDATYMSLYHSSGAQITVSDTGWSISGPGLTPTISGNDNGTGSFGGTLSVNGLSTFELDFKDFGAKPACDSTKRGTYHYDEGDAGVADTFEVCMKDAANAYAWKVIATP